VALATVASRLCAFDAGEARARLLARYSHQTIFDTRISAGGDPEHRSDAGDDPPTDHCAIPTGLARGLATLCLGLVQHDQHAISRRFQRKGGGEYGEVLGLGVASVHDLLGSAVCRRSAMPPPLHPYAERPSKAFIMYR
jgi:hypothetical protein